MKAFTTIGTLALCTFILHADEAAVGAGANIKPIVVSERPTHAALAKKQAEQKAHKHKHAENKELKPIVTVKKRSLIGNSTLIASGAHWTIVPQGSIIHLPKRLKDKVVSKPQGKMQNWPDFLRENYGWIHLHPISMQHAHGQKFLGEEAMKAYKTVGKMVIATCGGNPISVAPKAFVPPVETSEKK